MKTIFLVASLIALTSSAQAFEQPASIIVADAKLVEGCQYLGIVEGPTGYRLTGSPAVLGSFKADAMKKAKELNATHISWAYEDSGLERSIIGNVYRCSDTVTIARK